MSGSKWFFAIAVVFSATIIFGIVGLSLSNANIGFASKPTIIVAEGTDGSLCALGGLAYGFKMDSIASYTAGTQAIVHGDTTMYFRDSLCGGATFSWKITSQEKLFAWGWRTVYFFEVHVPNDNLPKNIFNHPLAWVDYKDGRTVKITPLGY